MNMRQMKVKCCKIEVKIVQFEFSKGKTDYNLEVLTMKVKKKYNVDDGIDFIFDGNQSDLSGLWPDKEENNKI